MFTTVEMKAHEDQLNAGFERVCEVHSTIIAVNLHKVLEWIARVCYRRDIDFTFSYR